MNEDKGLIDQQDLSSDENSDEKKTTTTASRARNRTVMLTPEMTGQVRALLHGDPGDDRGASDPLEDFLPPLVDWDATGQEDPQDGYGNGQEESRNNPTGSHNISAPGPNLFYQPATSSSTQDWSPPAGFDPMTSIAPSISGAGAQQPTAPSPRPTNSGVRPAVQPPPSKSGGQPSFSVNRAANTPSQAQAQAQARAQRPLAPVAAAPKSKIVGFLVSFDADKFGDVFEIRAGRWLLTSRPTDHGEFILIDDETISPLHAIIRATKDGKIQVLDQLSEFGTGVIRVGATEETEVAGGLETVSHGDTVRFGERYFVICTIPAVAHIVADESEGDE